MAKNIKLPEKKKSKLADAVARVAQKKTEQHRQQSSERRQVTEDLSPAAVNRRNYLRSQGIDLMAQRQEQRDQREQARMEAARMLAGTAMAAGARREATALRAYAQGRELAHDASTTGRLPEGYRWYRQGDRSIAVRDFAHKPLDGVSNTILQYYGAAQQANEQYGKQYGQTKTELDDLTASYEYAKQVVERGNADPAYADAHPEYYLLTGDDPNQNLSGYEKLVAQKQQELDRLNTEFNKTDALRPADMEGMTVRDSARMQGAYYQRPSVWNDPVLSPVIDTVDGAYQMLTGGQSLKSLAQEDAQNGKEGIGFLRGLGAGAVMGGNQLNDTLLGIAENAVDLTGSWLGKKIDPNWENPITKLREGNQRLGYAAYGDELENATGAERVLMNVTASGLNSAAHMAMGGMMGKGLGMLGGGGTMPTAMQAARAQGMTGFGNMGSFTLGAMTDAYDRAEADGSPAYMRPIRAIAAGMGSMIANSDNVEKFMQRMGIGAGMDKTGISNFVGTKMYSKWGDAAMNWAADTFGDQALSEGTQEVVEKIIDRTLDAGFTGNLLNAEYWDGFADELGEDFFYGYLSGALYNTMALPNYAPSNQMLNGMVTGETETTPETMVRWFEQVATDMGDPEMQRIAQQATQEMQNAGDVQAAKTGVVERMLTAADALVAKQEQKAAAEAAVPEIQADEEGVSRFDRPMAATVIDAEDGSGEVQVVGFETTQDGRNVVLHTVDAQGNRGTAMAGELNFADDIVQQLMTADDAKNLSGESLQSYLRDYASEVDGHSVTPEEYARGYGMVYRRAAAGMGMADAIRNSVIPQVMTQSAMQDAYASGLGAGAATQESITHSPTSATNGVMNRNFTTGAWNSMTRQQQRVAAANMEVVSVLAKRMGATINIVDSITDSAGNRANGRYDAKTGQIDIALNADANAYAYVAMHELTHQLKDQHSDSWSTFSGWVQEALTDKGQDFEKLVKYQMDSFGLSREDAAEEVICNTVPAMLQDEGTLQKLYEQDRTLFEKLMDWLKNLISDVKAAGKVLSERSQSWKQMGALKEDAATLQGLYDVMESIMQSERTNTGDNSAVKASRQDSGGSKHYDYSKPFAEQVEDLLNGNFPKDSALIVSGTPDVLRKIGFSSLPLTMNQEHLLKMHKDTEHELSREFIRQLPELIKNPIAVIGSETNAEKSLVMILHAFVNKKPYIAPMYISTNSSTINALLDSNNIATTFRKDNAVKKLFSDALKKENAKQVGVYYWNKTEARSLFEGAGVQFPEVSIQDGLIHSIFDAGSPVKAQFMEQTETRQFKKWFAGSKVVNPDGSPKVLYHQTGNEFSVFDPMHKGAGSRDNETPFGIFLKESDKDIGLGGKQQMALYAKIVNPLVVQNRTELVRKLSEMSGNYRLAKQRANEIDKEYSAKASEAEAAFNNYLRKIREENEQSGIQRTRKDLYEDPEFNRMFDAEDKVVEEWQTVAEENDKAAKEEIVRALKENGYDGIILREDTGSWGRKTEAYIALDPAQVKSATDNIGLFDGKNPDIRFSMSDFDSAYSAAVEQGDTDKAKELVAQAAEASMPDSKLRTPDGKLRVVYHGTNSEDFTVFDPQYIGMSSGDTGFFGRGFYFAYSKGEASFYGRKRIIPAYLNLTKPFNFQENLHEYNGERTFDYNASSAVALMNFADKFPKIAEKITIDVARKGESFKEIPIREFADEYKKVLSDTEFLYDEVDGEFGDKETVVLADPEIHEFDYGGEKHTFKDYGFQKRVAGKVDKLSISYDYLASRVYSSVDMPNFTRVLLDHNKEFTATLKEMGYDGVIQSEDGDEAVAFESSQIKSAEPVTYDDAGNVIPLSERFQYDNPDIRYSMSDYDDTVREGENVLEELLTMTAAHRMTDAEAARVARKVLKAASSEMELEEATQRIKSIFDYASRSGDKLDMYGLSSEATALADDMLSQSKTLDMQHEEEVADLRYYLKHNQISLSTEQQKEAANLMGGSYSAYRKALFGRVNLNRNGSALDGAVWEQLHEAAPHLFPLDASSGDQVRLLMEAAEYVQPVYHNESGLDAREAAQWLTHELFNAYMSLSGVQSAAKEQNRLGLKLRQYRQVAERFAKEHKAAFDEAYAKVTKEASARITAATEKAEQRASKAIREAEADADLRVAKAQAGVDQRIAEAKEQNIADMDAYREAMREKAKAWRSEFVTRHRDVERKNRYRAQILRETNQLLKKVEKPTDTHHVQDELTGALTTFLKSLDLGRRSKERSIGDRILSLRNVMQDAANGEGGRSFLVDSDILESMRFMAEQLQGMDSLDQLTADQMEQVRNIVHCAVWTVNKADTTFADRKTVRISAAAGRFLMEAGKRQDVKDRSEAMNKARDFLTVGQMDSMHFFDKLGGAAKEMYQSLRDGLDKKTLHRANAMEYVAEAVSKIPAKDQADLFAGKKAKKTRYELTGGSIELTKAQVMELYCLNKREQARGHLYDETVGGIRAGDNQNARAVKVQPKDIDKLTDTLTAQEKALADALQQYMVDECAKWGNETSMVLYGYKKFGEKNYYPIRVDPDSVDSNISQEGQQDNLYAIANMGMTKALKEKAKNALYIGDIFDTFSRHVDNMATYNAYAAPVADLVRWYNYRPGDGSSVKKMIQSKWGKEAAEYIPRLIRDLNGEVNRSYSPKLAEKMTGLMKSSSVGRNVRVAIQQPTAILRAGDMMDYRYITAGLTGLTGKGGNVKLKEAIELSKQHCPIALLKSMGFFETDMGKSLRAAMFDNRGVLEKLKDEGMWLPGKMDEMTFGAIWRACEAETRKLKPDLAVGSDAYYEAVGQRMSEIIDYTQVVDTPFHRTQLMRSSDGLTKMATSFLSEPSKTYNMLMSAMQNMRDNRHSPVAKKKFCRTLGAFAITAIVNAAAQSLIDAMRNGDNEDFWNEWGKAMFGDWKKCVEFMDYVRTFLDANALSSLNPLTMIPYIKDVLSMVQGYDVKRTDMQSMEKLMQVGTNVGNLINGKNKLSGWGWARQIATAVDSVTGQSFANALRDGYSFANLILKAIGLDPISEKTEVASISIAYDNLYDALLDGNARKQARVSEKLGKTQKEIDTAMAGKFADSKDDRVIAAYEAKQAGHASEYARIRAKFADEYGAVLGEGGNKRAEEIFDKAVTGYGNALNKDSEPEEEKEATPLNSNAYTYKDAASVVQGYANGTASLEDVELVRSEMIADSTAKDPQKTVDTNILKQLKPLYIAAGPAERKQLGNVIKKVFGKDDKYLANWVK